MSKRKHVEPKPVDQTGVKKGFRKKPISGNAPKDADPLERFITKYNALVMETGYHVDVQLVPFKQDNGTYSLSVQLITAQNPPNPIMGKAP
jgi:hypothetical protein